jgi:hypothetical protein
MDAYQPDPDPLAVELHNALAALQSPDFDTAIYDDLETISRYLRRAREEGRKQAVIERTEYLRQMEKRETPDA